MSDDAVKTFTVSYRSDGEDGTTAQLNGPNYGPQYIVGKWGAFANVPEGDGYSLQVTYGNANQTQTFAVHGDVDLPFFHLLGDQPGSGGTTAGSGDPGDGTTVVDTGTDPTGTDTGTNVGGYPAPDPVATAPDPAPTDTDTGSDSSGSEAA